MTKTLLLFLVLSTLAAASDDNTGRLVSKAAKELMEFPIGDARPVSTGDGVGGYEVHQPSHSDLAISRLQDKVIHTIDKAWEIVRDPRRLAILGTSVESPAKGILSILAQDLVGDVFAMDRRTQESGVVSAVTSQLGLTRAERYKWEPVWIRLRQLLAKIDTTYEFLAAYMDNPDKATDAALEDYARSVIEPGSSQETSLLSALVEIHNLSMPRLGLRLQEFYTRNENDVFHRLKNILSTKEGEHLCSMGQSPHQLIYNLYNVIALTEIKGYAMIQFSYMMLKLYNRGNFTLESELARRSFETQATDKLLAVKGLLPNMSRDFWRCDPKKHVEGRTFVRMTKLLQGIIENEVDMNNIATCRENCASYRAAETEGRCFKNKFCAKQERCSGRIYDCKFYHADAFVCMSENSNERRYDWVEYEDGQFLGQKNGQCRNKIKVDSWWRWLVWHCSYCLCKCDSGAGDPNSDRFVSLRPATTDVDGNRVLTGVRFVKRNRVLQIEIEQAEALPEGGIDEDSREWLVPEPMDKDKDREDIMVLSYEQRSLDTDRLEAPPGHIVTGVKLRNLGGHVNLELQVTPIKFTNGKLITDRSTWIGNDNTPASRNPRQQVDILMADVPTRVRGPSKIDTAHNEYVQFDATSPHKDVMQTTIPYIDSQPVAPSTGTWVSGVGLYHKGTLGSGGYVGIILRTFDFSKHLLPEKTKEELKFDFEAVRRQQRLNNQKDLR